MSWDIVLFSSRQKIQSVEELDEMQLEPTDFCAVLESHCNDIERRDNHRRIKGKDFEMEYFQDDEPVCNKILVLYGESGLYELVMLARKHNWQLFDTGHGHMINLEDPSINGYESYQWFLQQVLKEKE